MTETVAVSGVLEKALQTAHLTNSYGMRPRSTFSGIPRYSFWCGPPAPASTVGLGEVLGSRRSVGLNHASRKAGPHAARRERVRKDYFSGGLGAARLKLCPGALSGSEKRESWTPLINLFAHPCPVPPAT